jgi:raffinose/stachyose/melibiose transport system permease protein
VAGSEAVLGRRRSNDIGGPWANGAILFALCLWAVMQLYPVFWLFMSSLKPSTEVRAKIFALPSSLYLENYNFAAFNRMNITLHIYLRNSVVVAAFSLLLLTIISVLAAYGIAKLRVIGKNALIVILLGLMGVPVHGLMIPIFYFFARLRLLDHVIGLILPYTAFNVPFAVLILQSYFRQFPDELIDAARIDGCSKRMTFFQVVMPISLGAISSVTILNFIGIWNEFLFALVMMRDNAAKTLPVGLMGFKGRYVVQWGPMMAALVIAIIPTIVFYFIFHRNLMKGVSVGAIKG